MGLFAVPLNSSHQFVVHVIAPVAGVVPHCALVNFGSTQNRIAIAVRRVRLKRFVP
jgi:hypothetical protein